MTPGFVLSIGLLQQAAEESSSGLDDAKTIVEIIGTAITAVAVIVGGGWALWRFGRERTYRPRLDVDLSGGRVAVAGTDYLLARVRVKNIGTSEINLRQYGTGLRVSRLPSGGPAADGKARWQTIKVWPVLEEHEWIEPSETVSDDLLLHLSGVGPDDPVLLEARLVWFNAQSDGPVVVRARRVLTKGDTLTEPAPEGS